MLYMYIADCADQRICFSKVKTVDEGRDLWAKIAGVSAGQTLTSFQIEDEEENRLYTGDYVTDEC